MSGDGGWCCPSLTKMSQPSTETGGGDPTAAPLLNRTDRVKVILLGDSAVGKSKYARLWAVPVGVFVRVLVFVARRFSLVRTRVPGRLVERFLMDA